MVATFFDPEGIYLEGFPSTSLIEHFSDDPYSIQFTTSSRRLDGGAYCGAPVGGKCMVSKAKLVLYAFAV